MKNALLVVGLCLMAQSGFAYEGERPQPRPQFCPAPGGGALVPCARLWNAAYKVERPAVKQAAVRQPAPKPVAARKIIRLPWTIGAYQ